MRPADLGSEVVATTESPVATLDHHAAIRAANASGEWGGRVITAYRPDPVVDPEYEGFRDNLERFSDLSGEDAFSYAGYLAAHRNRRSEEHTSELQSLMRISYAVFCLKKKNKTTQNSHTSKT